MDYTLQKGAWEVQTFKVGPNHIDDDVTGLRKEYISVQEIMKSHGIIDQYVVMTKLKSGAGANLMIVQHFPNLSHRSRQSARSGDREIYAKFPEDQSAKTVAEFNKYRTFESDEFWTAVEFPP